MLYAVLEIHMHMTISHVMPHTHILTRRNGVPVAFKKHMRTCKLAGKLKNLDTLYASNALRSFVYDLVVCVVSVSFVSAYCEHSIEQNRNDFYILFSFCKILALV